MKSYKPEKMVAVSRYQNYFPTLPQEVREDVYRRMDQLLSEENEYCDQGIIKEWIPLKQDIQKDIGINHQFHIWKAFLPAGSDGPHQQGLFQPERRRSHPRKGH